jgi:hypothetical protein
VVVDNSETSSFERRLSNTRVFRELGRQRPVDLGGVRIFPTDGSRPAPTTATDQLTDPPQID